MRVQEYLAIPNVTASETSLRVGFDVEMYALFFFLSLVRGSYDV